MSTASEPVIDSSQRIDTKSEHLMLPLSNEQDNPATKRSEKPRHVFPHLSRRPVHYSRGRGPSISKPDHYMSAYLHMRQLKPRGTFQRVINSFFDNIPGRQAHSASPRARSRTSSFGSRLGSPVHGPVPSLDLISPGVFLFSGPSLQPAGSYNNSSPRLPSLRGSFHEAHVSRHIHSDSSFMINNTSIEDNFLEPIVGRDALRNMSNVLLGITTPIAELGNSLFEGLNGETVLRNPNRPQNNDPSSRPSRLSSSSAADDLFQNLIITALILYHSDTATWRSLRLACRSWYKIVSHVAPPPARPASGRLPTEILLSIYNHLGVKDFNASRRTCRTWMMASLNKNLLGAMLHRGGWHSGIEAKDASLAQGRSTAAISDEWRLSRYLSRQCAVTAGWTGNGLDYRPAIVESSAIDFSELANGYSLRKSRSSGALIFTSSICGKYLLVAKDTVIYIYDLKDGLLKPVSSVVCPRTVLAVSMNASVGRDAVAALLEGRMGVVCELRYGRALPECTSRKTCVKGDGNSPRTSAWPVAPTEQCSGHQDAIDSAEHTSSRALRSFPYIRDMDPGSFNAIELKTHNQGFDLRDTDDARTHDRNLINQAWNLSLRGSPRHLGTNPKTTLPVQNIPIESSTSTFYRHLCSEDDPPRNVSICPQRRCVAFGCLAGIELHWIDALTGQSLSRWFPLTSPSDHLYFLSPRPEFESGKKLRLISSAAHPNDRPAINRRLFSTATISTFWGSFGFEASSRQFQNCDHYHAIPLSDGHHVLFIDPSMERLTLGCDAPFGGPTRLLRKVVLNPPEGLGVPRVYTAAADLSSGAQIVVAFDNIIVLYSIPPDVLALSRLEQTAENPDISNTPPFSSAGRHHDHWLNWWDKSTGFDPVNRSEVEDNSSVWPISLSGTEVGRLPDICELAIQTRPDLLIWAFTNTSQCKTWRLRNYVDPIVRSRQYVDQSGLVHEFHNIDGSRNVIMQDAPPSSVDSGTVDSHADEDERERPTAEETGMEGLDGNALGMLKRMPRALAVENDGSIDTIDVAGCADAWYERGGDVVTWHEI